MHSISLERNRNGTIMYFTNVTTSGTVTVMPDPRSTTHANDKLYNNIAF